MIFNKAVKNLGEEAAKSAINTVKDTAQNDITVTLKKASPFLGLLALYICFNRRERMIYLREASDLFFF